MHCLSSRKLLTCLIPDGPLLLPKLYVYGYTNGLLRSTKCMVRLTYPPVGWVVTRGSMQEEKVALSQENKWDGELD